MDNKNKNLSHPRNNCRNYTRNNGNLKKVRLTIISGTGHSESKEKLDAGHSWGSKG